MFKNTFCTLLLLVWALSPLMSQKTQTAYSSEDLKIIPLTDHSFLHITYLEVPEYGRVACNGLVYLNSGEAIVFDTPTDDKVSRELIRWIRETKEHQVTAVVINHFHVDCVGGLSAFHELGIPSYANTLTQCLAKEKGNPVPQQGFTDLLELQVGKEKVINRFFGEAHSSDNIASYIPSESLLFGGCAVKSMGAGKGNLADANETTWSGTMGKIKTAYPKVRIVVPGHGDPGGIELLEYTQKMFEIQ